MDAVSEVLRTVRLISAVYLEVEFRAPWGLASPPPHIVAPLIADHCNRVVIFHVVREGRVRVHAEPGSDTCLETGDVLLFPRGTTHTLSNGVVGQFIDAADAIRSAAAEGTTRVCAGGDGDITRLVCGYLGCARHSGRLLLDGLPAMLKLHIAGDGADDWLEQSLRFVLAQASDKRPGHHALLSRLSETVLIEALRRYVNGRPSSAEAECLLAARDPIVGRTLAAIRNEPSRDWTIASLADAVGSSRSILTGRFSHLMGEPPMTFLAHVRLRIAAQLLKTTNRSVLDVAGDVGYQSEAAFIRAFRREFGNSPGRFRHN